MHSSDVQYQLPSTMRILEPSPSLNAVGLIFNSSATVLLIPSFIDFGLGPDVVSASLGNLGVEEVVGIEAMVSMQLNLPLHFLIQIALQIPDNFAIGRQECLDRCGLSRGTQKTTQRQPRVSGNALPSSETSSAASAASTPASSASSSAPPAASTPAQKRDSAWTPVQLRKRD